jgi:hypothetical protein
VCSSDLDDWLMVISPDMEVVFLQVGKTRSGKYPKDAE